MELLEFDEIGALIRYVGDRKTREAIVDRVALLNTQGRALGYTVRGYVQEPTKDTVPVRELFPRRICLRVASKTHVAMVLGDQAYDRGAWANRIGESEAGIGYLFGEGIREPLRVRAGWVSDETIKELEAFVTGAAPPPCRPGRCSPCPRPLRCRVRPPEVRPDDTRARTQPRRPRPGTGPDGTESSTRTSSPGRRRRCSPSPATSPGSSPKTTACASDRWPCAASTSPPAGSTSSRCPAGPGGRTCARRAPTSSGGCA